MKIRALNRIIKKNIKNLKRKIYNFFYDIDNSKIQINKDEIKKILIVNGSAIGNLVAYTPLIETFKAINSDIGIDFVTEGISKDAIRYDKRINGIYENQDIEILQNNKYDLVIFIGEIDIKEHVFLKSLRAKYYVGSTKRFKLFNLIVKDNDNDHITEMLNEITQKIFGVNCSKDYKIYVDDSRIDTYRKKLNTSKKIIAINKFTSTRWKDVEDDQYVKLIKELINRNYFVVGLYPPKEKERMKRIKKEIGSLDFFYLDESKSILDSIYLMKIADLVISSDTSLVHLACGLKKPLIGLYVKSSFYKKWSPNIDCSMQIIYDTGDREGKKRGITNLNVDLIFFYLDKLLKGEKNFEKSLEVKNG